MPSESKPADQPESGFFRCPVQTDHSQAIIRVGRRKIRALVQETSIDGFTVLVSPPEATRLKVGRPWVLEHEGTRTEIHPQWFFNIPNGQMQLGLRRLRDLTPPPKIGKSMLARIAGKRYQDPNYSAAAFGGFVLFLFGLMSLPGLGDRLGTSVRIQAALRWVYSEVNLAISSIL